MSPTLAATRQTYVDARNRLLALLDGLPDDAFNAKPSAKGWSAGECVVHLNKTHRDYLPQFEAVAERDEPRGEGPWAYGWMATRFVEAVRPGSRPLPTGGKLKPPSADGLRSEIDRGRAVSRFEADIEALVAAVERMDGLDLGAIKMRSPVLPVIRFPVGAFVEAMGLHALRHVMQAERAVEAFRTAQSARGA